MDVPRRLRFTDCAAAGDGGSLLLQAFDEADREWIVHLGWSIQARKTYGTKLSINGRPLEKGTVEEWDWIERIRGGLPTDSEIVPDPPPAGGMIHLQHGQSFFRGTPDTQPTEGLRNAVRQLLRCLDSETYRAGPPDPPPNLEETLRGLLNQGLKLNAMQIYRKANPGASIREAQRVVEQLEADL